MFSVNPEFDETIGQDVSIGPRVGFLQGAAIAHDAGFDETEGGANFNLYDKYDEQRRTLESQGFAMPQIRSKTGKPFDAIEVGKYLSGEDSEIDPLSLDEYDAKIESIKTTHPQLKLRSNRELWDETKLQAQTSAKALATTRTTTGGAIGEFVGSVVAGVNPIANFTNAATLPVGGVGKTVLARVATEGLSQSAVESANEFLAGGRTTRKMLGLDSSVEGSVTRIGMAGVGGSVIRGGFEGVGAGWRAGRRWFADTPVDPAPALPELKPTEPLALTPEQRHAIRAALPEHTNPAMSRTSLGRGRVLDDLTHFQERLDAWDGEAPVEIRPRTDTSIPDPYTGVRFSEDVDTRAALGRLSVDEAARRVDPDAFRVYDSLAAKAEAIRAELASAKPDTNEWARLITEANNKVSDLTDQIGERRLPKTKQKELIKQRDAAIAERDAIMSEPRTSDTPRQTQLREQLVHHDIKMRDMAPVISRAYSHARGQQVASQTTREAVNRMVAQRASNLSPEDAKAVVDTAEKSFRIASPLDGSPIMARVNPSDIEPGKPLVKAALRVVEEDAKLAEENLTAFRDSLKSILDDEKNGKLVVGSHEFDLNDKLEVPNADGEGSRTITVRELLDEMREADSEVEAMKICSI